jgi:hypothetical protein
MTRIALAWVFLFIVESCTAGLSIYTALSAAVTIGVLFLIVRAAPGFLPVFALYAGLSCVSTLMEAVVFGVISPMRFAGALASGLVSAAAVAFLMDYRRCRQAASSPNGLAWKLPALAIVHVVVYFIAGVLVYPCVRDFYANRTLPSVATLALLQLARGLAYVGFAWPFLTSGTRSRLTNAGLLALAFPALEGIAPLLLPNDLMPPYVRLAHALEITGSKLIFGFVTGWLLTRRQPHETKNSCTAATV